jgi:DNA-binding MarR family transcriptional regulator
LPAADDPVVLWRALREAVLGADRRREVSAELGLSIIKVRLIRLLTDGPLAQRDIAAALVTDPAYTTVVVGDLEQRGLVSRCPAPHDGRVRLVSLTADGSRVAARAAAIVDRPPVWLAELPVAERRALARGLSAGR